MPWAVSGTVAARNLEMISGEKPPEMFAERPTVAPRNPGTRAARLILIAEESMRNVKSVKS